MTETKKQNGVEGNQASDFELQIICQIEYYFGDHNMTRDKFMKNAVKENDGWIPLETMVKFNRLKSLTSDYEVIITALSKSPNKLIEVSEDRLNIRRAPDKPIPEFNQEWKDSINVRTLYVKGFPVTTTLDNLLEFFRQHGDVENIFMRRKPDKNFKGSVFATFKTTEEAENFLKKENVMYKESKLLREFRNDYMKRKQDLYQKRQEEREKKQKLKTSSPNKDDASEIDKEKKGDAEGYKKGCVLHLKGFKENTSREDIKETFDDYSKIAWVEFSRGDTEAWVRFEKENAAATSLEKAKEANNGKLQIREADIESYVLEGEEEAEFWKRVALAKEERRQKGKNQKNQRGKGGYRGRNRGGWAGKKSNIVQFQGKKRKFDDDEDSGNENKTEVVSEKKHKFDEDSGNENKTEMVSEESNIVQFQGKKRKFDEDSGNENKTEIVSEEASSTHSETPPTKITKIENTIAEQKTS